MKSPVMSSILALTTSCFLPAFAAAQNDEADNANKNEVSDTLPEIVVTASKREERLQDVPMSIKAMSGKLLSERGDMTFEDYASSIPSLTFQKVGNAGESQITLRGMGATSGSGTVSVYVDGATMTALTARSDNPDLTLFDMDRIEVLRGPQGTLYGESSIGGTIKLITNRPVTDKVEAKISAGAEDYNSGGTGFNYNGMLNIPLIEDKFAIRLVGAFRDNDGYIDAPNQNLNDINTDKTDSLRFQALLNVTEDFTATLIYNYQKGDFGSANQVTSPVDASNPFTVNTFHTSKASIKLQQANLLINWDLDWATLESISSVSERTSENFTERGSLLGGSSFPSSVPADVDIKSEELRLMSNGNNKLNWTIGFYYKKSHRVASFDFTPVIDDFDLILPSFGLPDTRTGLGLAPGIPIAITADERSELEAGFGEVNWKFSQDWSLTLGLRFFNEDVSTKIGNTLDPAFTYIFAAFGFFPFPVPGSFEILNAGKTTYTGTTWKAVLDYKLDENILAYASVSTGFRPGGANPPASFASAIVIPKQFDKDTVINYELGLKSLLLNNKLSINTAFFLMDWSNMQIDADPTQLTLPGIRNGPDAQSKGVELDVLYTPISGLTIGMGGAYIDATANNADIRFAGSPDEITLFNAGEKLPNTAEWTANASIAYEFPIVDTLNGLLRADFSYRGETFGNLPNLDSNHVDAYSLFNLRAGLISDQNWRLQIYANNIFNKHSSITEFTGVFANLVQPRTIGFTLSYDYN